MPFILSNPRKEESLFWEQQNTFSSEVDKSSDIVRNSTKFFCENMSEKSLIFKKYIISSFYFLMCFFFSFRFKVVFLFFLELTFANISIVIFFSTRENNCISCFKPQTDIFSLQFYNSSSINGHFKDFLCCE